MDEENKTQTGKGRAADYRASGCQVETEMYTFFFNLCASKTRVKEKSRKMHIKRTGMGI